MSSEQVLGENCQIYVEARVSWLPPGYAPACMQSVVLHLCCTQFLYIKEWFIEIEC